MPSAAAIVTVCNWREKGLKLGVLLVVVKLPAASATADVKTPAGSERKLTEDPGVNPVPPIGTVPWPSTVLTHGVVASVAASADAASARTDAAEDAPAR